MIIATRGCNVYPVSVIRVISLSSVGADGSDGYNPGITGRRAPGITVITGREKADTARHRTCLFTVGVHPCIGIEIIDGRLQCRGIFSFIGLQIGFMPFPGFFTVIGTIRIGEIISPAIVAENGTVIGRPFDGSFKTAAAIVRKNLAGHDLDTLNSFCSVTTGHSGNSDSIVVDSGDRAGHMGAMFIGSDIIALRYEIVTGRYIDVSSQIFMIELDTAVDDGDND